MTGPVRENEALRAAVGPRIARRATATLALFLAAGCATVTVPDRVDLTPAKAKTASVKLVDQRPPAAREYREDAFGGSRKLFADAVFRPPVTDLLAARVGEAMPEHLRGLDVDLVQLDVGFLVVPPASRGGAGQPFIPYGVPAGAAIIGSLIAAGIIAGIDRARAEESAIAFIEIRVGNDALRATRTVTINKDTTTAKALDAAVAAAIDDLAQQTADLGKPKEEASAQ